MWIEITQQDGDVAFIRVYVCVLSFIVLISNESVIPAASRGIYMQHFSVKKDKTPVF